MFFFTWKHDKKREKQRAEQQRKRKRKIALEKKRQKKRAVLERKKNRQRLARERERERKREIKERQKEKLRRRKEIERERKKQEKEIEKEQKRMEKEIEKERKRQEKEIERERKMREKEIEREQKRRAKEEKRREKERIVNEKKRIAEEKKRIAEEKKIIAEEKKRIAEEKKNKNRKNEEERKRKKETIDEERMEHQNLFMKKVKVKEKTRIAEEESGGNKFEHDYIKTFEAVVEKWEKIALEKIKEFTYIKEESKEGRKQNEKNEEETKFERLEKINKLETCKDQITATEKLVEAATANTRGGQILKQVQLEPSLQRRDLTSGDSKTKDTTAYVKPDKEYDVPSCPQDDDRNDTVCYSTEDLSQPPDCAIRRPPSALSTDISILSEPAGDLSDLNDNDERLLDSDSDHSKDGGSNTRSRNTIARNSKSIISKSRDSKASDSTSRDRTSRDSTSRDRTSRDSSSRDRTSSHSTSRDRTSRDSSSRDKTSRDSRSRERTSRDSRSRDRTSRDSSSGDRISRDSRSRGRTSRDRTSINRTSRDSRSRDRTSRDSRSGDRTSRDSSSRDRSSRDSSSRDRTSRDSRSRDRTSRDSTSRDRTSRDSSSRDRTSRDSRSRDRTSRGSTSRDRTSRDSRSRDRTSRGSTSNVVKNNKSKSVDKEVVKTNETDTNNAFKCIDNRDSANKDNKTKNSDDKTETKDNEEDLIEITAEDVKRYKFYDWDCLPPALKKSLVMYHVKHNLECPWIYDNFPRPKKIRKRKAFGELFKTLNKRKTEVSGSRKKRNSERASSSSGDEMADEVDQLLNGESSSSRNKVKVQIPNALDQDEESDDYDAVEVYDNYKPLKLKIGLPHPDLVVESASLASVEPTDITHRLGLPEATINEGKLSALQLEAIVYSAQAHDQMLPNKSRAGFLIGDGAGVGKGRTVAGVIFENYLKGRKRAVWVSVSNDLKYDAERDLRDIGACDDHYIKVHSFLKDFPYGGMQLATEGVMFVTYSALSRSVRLGQLLAWCGDDFDGVIVLDECHKAKNLCPSAGKGKPTKAGQAVLMLQERLPKARLVYASATGATEPRNMAYMVRLGLWGKDTAFDTFTEFINVVEKGGVGAMEIVAMDMKLRGMYIARQLSFHGVSFKIEEVPLSDSFKKTYDEAVALWVEAKRQLKQGIELYCAMCAVEPNYKRSKWAQFWGAHQRFFKYLCLAAKVDRAVEIALQAVADGKCAVIGLQSTGEARTLAQLDEGDGGELTDFFSTAEGVLKNLVEKQFPGANKEDEGFTSPELREIQKGLLDKLCPLSARLPRNMLDDLVHRLGGARAVAEMTGRRGRMVKVTKNGLQEVKYESRMTDEKIEMLNIAEKELFLKGHKLIAVISEAASTGISLQSDRRVANQRRRVHITLELPWSADRAIQQFGRTHRSNQVNAPEYVLLISDLAGEKRFASTVAKRLESLGALTHGDRRATKTRDLSQFNIDNNGKEALKLVLRAVSEAPLAAEPPGAGFMSHARSALNNVGLTCDEVEKCTLTKFMNRLLGVPVQLQNQLFQFFTDKLTEVMKKAQRAGNFDIGIMDLSNARCTSTLRVLRQHATGLAPVQLHTVLVDRGMDWNKAYAIFFAERKRAAAEGNKDVKAVLGFYRARNAPSTSDRQRVLLYVGDRHKGQIYRPGTGQTRPESFSTIDNGNICLAGPRWQTRARNLWVADYEQARTMCSHTYSGRCSKENCTVGLRERQYHVLSGSVLAVWDQLEFARMQVVRVRTDTHRIVGTLIHPSSVSALEASLKADAVSVTTSAASDPQPGPSRL